MSLLFTNNATGTLSVALTTAATSLVLQTGQGAKFPSPTASDNCLVTLVGITAGVETSWEIVSVTARTADTLTIVRAQESTTAAAWAINTPVELRLTLAGLSALATVDGTNPVGFRHIPQIVNSAAYTLVLTDAGKHILHPSADTAAQTFTIPDNASVVFPVGAAITFINQASAGVVTIAITTDTMRLAGAGTTGSRTLAANGMATAIKLTATEWIISGVNLT